ncbi:MAG: GNAT family N-acetyltransferase [Micrococcales bacterium]|nr:GNAT family N-acetyltransferase [Micrococcales bacterium]
MDRTPLPPDETVLVRAYRPDDEDALFALIEREGEEWKDYWQGSGRAKYLTALTGSIVDVLFEGDELCGYVRSRDDDGFGVYILDLLVDQRHRGKHHGRRLMEHVCQQHPDDDVYVTSDVDPYYEKLGYTREGTVFVVQRRP